MKLSSAGNCCINAPTPVAKTPIATIRPVSPVIAVTPINAKGATNATCTRTLAIAFIKVINRLAFSVAFCIFCIKASTPTKATNGTAIAVSDTTPRRADAIKLPTIVNGINNSVKADANIVNANTFVVAFCTFCIRANTPTNANNGTAIAVRDTTPRRACATKFPIIVKGINNTVIAVAKAVNANTFVVAT